MNTADTLIAFTLDDQRYGLYLSAVEKVVRTVEITSLPKAPDIIAGVINVQGRIIPVVDIRKRFGLPQREMMLSDQLIIARTSKRPVAMIVDAVQGVIEYSEEMLIPANEIVHGIQLLQLINDVLDLAKVEAGKMEFHPEPVDLARIIGEVQNIVCALAAQKRILLESMVASEVTEVVVDPAKLKQVLYNFVSNALKFTPEAGRVTIRVLPDNTDAFRLEVEDTGIGIRPEDMERLFLEFQQLDTSAAKKYPGTGLGLALTKRIVEAQGGQVGVRSMYGKGSIFHTTLPCITHPSSILDVPLSSSHGVAP